MSPNQDVGGVPTFRACNFRFPSSILVSYLSSCFPTPPNRAEIVVERSPQVLFPPRGTQNCFELLIRNVTTLVLPSSNQLFIRRRPTFSSREFSRVYREQGKSVRVALPWRIIPSNCAPRQLGQTFILRELSASCSIGPRRIRPRSRKHLSFPARSPQKRSTAIRNRRLSRVVDAGIPPSRSTLAQIHRGLRRSFPRCAA